MNEPSRKKGTVVHMKDRKYLLHALQKCLKNKLKAQKRNIQESQYILCCLAVKNILRTVFFYLYSILNLISFITSCTDCYKNYLIVYSASSNRKISFLQRISVRKERFKKREFFRTLNHFCKGRMRNIISTTLNDYIFNGNFF